MSEAAIDVHYQVEGPATAPVVLVSHALGAALAMWEPQMPALSEKFRVVRYDQRGHGRSPVPSGPYSIAELAGDLLRLLDRLDLDRIHFCGLSLGGMVGMWLASHAPDRIDRLVLCCTAARMMRPPDYAQRAELVRREGMAAVADAVIGRWFTPDFAASQPKVVSSIRSMLLSTPAEGYAGGCEALSTMDLRPDLARITAPTLVIAGSEDQSTPVAQSKEIAATIPGARLDVVSDASHLANLARPEEVTDLILNFISGH
jgi:3-oxoadipate enol-lactonase